jgi:hypothetical protein
MRDLLRPARTSDAVIMFRSIANTVELLRQESLVTTHPANPGLGLPHRVMWPARDTYRIYVNWVPVLRINDLKVAIKDMFEKKESGYITFPVDRVIVRNVPGKDYQMIIVRGDRTRAHLMRPLPSPETSA